MNHRKRKQVENQKRKVYTPEGYIKDPPDAVCRSMPTLWSER